MILAAPFGLLPSGWDPPHPLLAFTDVRSKLVPLEQDHLTLPSDVDSFAFQKFAGAYFQVCAYVQYIQYIDRVP